jgi:CPA2 family monovalent cation:H+ antiporter-2
MAVEAGLLIRDFAIVMLAALGFGYVASRLGQPPMLGYLLAGLAIGPMMRLVSNVEQMNVLATIGVSLLMFMAGLEFSSKRLQQTLRFSVPIALAEMGFLFFLGLVAGLLMGAGLVPSIVLGMALTATSTIVVAKMLNERGQLDSQLGRLLIGILIVEDLVAIAMVTGLGAYGRDGSISAQTLALPLVGGLSFLIVMMLLGKRVLPAVFNTIGRTRSKEILLLAIFGVCIGTAAMASFFQLSIVLGAFIAGLMLAESEHHFHVAQQIEPLKDLFLIVFFVSVGMSVDPAFIGLHPDVDPARVAMNWGAVLVLVGIVILGKAFIVALTTRVIGYHSKTAVLAGIGMVNIGEFSFIITKLAYDARVVPENVYSVTVLTALVTMAATPYLIRSGPRIFVRLRSHKWAASFARWMPASAFEAEEGKRATKRSGHVVVLGAGGVTEHTIEVLHLEKRPLVVVDNDMNRVERLRKLDVECIYGDAANRLVLSRAGVPRAKCVLIALPGEFDTQEALGQVRRMNASAYVAARAHREEEIASLQSMADEVVLAHLVAGKRMAWRVMERLGFDEKEIARRMRGIDPQVIRDIESRQADQGRIPSRLSADGGKSESFFARWR